MDGMIKGVPWRNAREAQANAQHKTAWCWQPTPVQLLRMLCLHTCPSPTASREAPSKDWPNGKGEDIGRQTQGPAQVGFPLAQTSDLCPRPAVTQTCHITNCTIMHISSWLHREQW